MKDTERLRGLGALGSKACIEIYFRFFLLWGGGGAHINTPC